MAAVAAVAIGAYSAYEGSRQAGRAADKQENQAKLAAIQQRLELQATEKRLEPFAAPGAAAIQQQSALTGGGTPEEQQQAFAAFSQSPGQQFLRDQQERSLLRNASAIGGLGGGNVRSALQQQAFGRAQTDIGNQFNRLASISGSAQTAATNLGQFGQQAAGNIGQLQMQAGAARASGILGQQQAQQQGLSNIAGIAAQSGAFNQNQQTTTQQPAQQQTTLNQPQQFQA